MQKPDVSALAQQMISAVKGYVSKSEAALVERIDAKIASIPAGLKGETGGAGPAGAPGERGADGLPGPQGPAGERGLDGTSGFDGKKGDAGNDGRDGKDGASIHPDTVALMVSHAVEKAVAALPKPKDGKDGSPGRDATELKVLPSIDESRSYQEGTYAKHNGGEIRAERRTDPVKDGDLLAAGWTVAREGIAALVVTQGDDPRVIEVGAMLTSGTKAVASFSVPMVIDRGVWREGEHEKGDHVSWDGSGWIAQRKSTDKPGTSDAWRLSTKRGRDGKDAEGARAAGPREPVRLR